MSCFKDKPAEPVLPAPRTPNGKAGQKRLSARPLKYLFNNRQFSRTAPSCAPDLARDVAQDVFSASSTAPPLKPSSPASQVLLAGRQYVWNGFGEDVTKRYRAIALLLSSAVGWGAPFITASPL